MLTGSRSLQSLRFAARLDVLAYHLGLLVIPLGVVTCVPAAVAWGFGRPDVALRQLGVAVLLVLLGFAGRRLGRSAELQRNEALVLSALAFCIASLAGTVPLVAYGMGPLDAWFEAVSGATTTGLSVLGSPEHAPRGLLFARAWLQWIGGLGVLVLALALVVTPGASARRLGFEPREMEDLLGGTRAHARRVLIVYLVLTVVGLGLLWALGMGLFDALLHVFAAVSTGGFATREGSLAAFPGSVQAAVLALCLSGSLAFACYFLLASHPRRILRDPRPISLLVCCIATAALLVALRPFDRQPSAASAVQLVGMAVSAQTTAGFSTVPVAETSPAARIVLIASMFVGGELGSTAGGFKIFRLLVMIKLLFLLLNRASIPVSGRLALRVGRERISAQELEGMVALLVASVALVTLSWLAFLLHGHDPLDSLFDVVSAVGTVGLSSGLTDAELEPVLKGVLSLDMLMGRVEVIAFVLLLRPATWIGRRRRS